MGEVGVICGHQHPLMEQVKMLYTNLRALIPASGIDRTISQRIKGLDPMVQERKEGNILFNDALNTFYFTVIWRRKYGKGPLSEKGNPLAPHVLLFPINSKGSFICTIPQTGEHTPRPLLHQSWSTGWNEK